MDNNIKELLAAYRQLGDYCAAYSERLRAEFASEITCRKGCSACCELTSVNALEAFLMAGYLQGKQQLGRANTANTCPLLENDCCLIYPARPLICQTPGLPIYGANLTDGEIDCCPLNFAANPTAITRQNALDAEMITENLMRLNLAFCMLIGEQALAGERIDLNDIIANNLPESFAAAMIFAKPPL